MIIPFYAPYQAPQAPAALFQSNQMWSVHLSFTREQWDAMTPKSGNNGGFGGGQRGGFGAGSTLGPIFVRAGDTNYDGSLSRAEFLSLGERWFTEWDSSKKGNLTLPELQTGLNATLKAPPMSLLAPEGKRNGVAGMMGIDFEFVHAQLDFQGKAFPDVAVRYKGNGTYLNAMDSPKKPLKIDLNKYVKSGNLAGITTLNLHNCVADSSWMNNTLALRFFREAGVPAPRTSYAKVYVTVPGLHEKQFLGLYEVAEDIGSNFLQEHFGAAEGALFKPSTSEIFRYQGEDWKRYNQTYDPKSKPTEAQKQRLLGLCKLVTTTTDAVFTKEISQYLDLAAFANYMAALVCVTDVDGLLGSGQNIYLYLHPKTNKFHFIPWDYDQSFGQFGLRGTQEQREQLSLKKPWLGENRFLERIFALPEFQTLYQGKLKSLSTTLFTPERLSTQVDELALHLRPTVAEESKELLTSFDALVAGNSVRPSGRFSGFSPIKPIKAFVPLRTRSIQDQLAGKSTGLVLGSSGPGGGNFGLGNRFAPGMLRLLDTNGDMNMSHSEVQAGFAAWFTLWDTDQRGILSEETLVAGLNKTFAPPPR
jgi:spore coat protein H